MALVRTTEIVAIPVALATCWVTLSSVDPRATSAALSVLSAEVNNGIIVEPIPSPVTNSQAMICLSDVPGSVLLASPNRPVRIPRKPNGTMRPTGILSDNAPAIGMVSIAPMPWAAMSSPAFLTE